MDVIGTLDKRPCVSAGAKGLVKVLELAGSRWNWAAQKEIQNKIRINSSEMHANRADCFYNVSKI